MLTSARPLEPALSLTIRQVRRACFRALVSERPLIARVRAGTKRIENPEGKRSISAGAVGLLPPRQPLTITNLPPRDEPYLAQALVVDEEIVTALHQPDILPGAALRTTTEPQILAAFERAVTAVSDPSCPPRLKRHAVEEVLLWLAEEGIGFGPLRPPSLVDRLRRLIDAAPDADWQAADAARHLGVSEATMRRRLAEAGTGFSETLADVRMAVALGLLQSTELSVTRIALDVGYASASRFAIRFRARFGLSPSELRGAVRNDRSGTEFERIGTDIDAADG